jgi:hypothetical protein
VTAFPNDLVVVDFEKDACARPELVEAATNDLDRGLVRQARIFVGFWDCPSVEAFA